MLGADRRTIRRCCDRIGLSGRPTEPEPTSLPGSSSPTPSGATAAFYSKTARAKQAAATATGVGGAAGSRKGTVGLNMVGGAAVAVASNAFGIGAGTFTTGETRNPAAEGSPLARRVSEGTEMRDRMRQRLEAKNAEKQIAMPGTFAATLAGGLNAQAAAFKWAPALASSTGPAAVGNGAGSSGAVGAAASDLTLTKTLTQDQLLADAVRTAKSDGRYVDLTGSSDTSRASSLQTSEHEDAGERGRHGDDEAGRAGEQGEAMDAVTEADEDDAAAAFDESLLDYDPEPTADVPETQTTTIQLSPNGSEPVFLAESRMKKFKSQHPDFKKPALASPTPQKAAPTEEVSVMSPGQQAAYAKLARRYRELRPVNTFSGIVDTFDRKSKLIALDKIERTHFDQLTEPFTKDGGLPPDIIGSCRDMCPERLRYDLLTRGQGGAFGVEEGYIHWLETTAFAPFGQKIDLEFFVQPVMDHARVVKDHKKVAADAPTPLPSTLRPAWVLDRTMQYLCREVMQYIDSDDLFNRDAEQADKAKREWHKFLEFRTRAIRQDISIQGGINTPGGILIFERIIRFHIFSGHYMCECKEYVDGQNVEQMDKASKTLTDMYAVVRSTHGPQPNEGEFRAYSLLQNLSNPGAFGEVENWPEDVISSKEVQFAITMFSLVQRGSDSVFNYAKFFKLARQTTLLNACILNEHFVWVRQHALKLMHEGFSRSQNHKVNIKVATVTRLLGFDNDEATEGFVEVHGMAVVEEEASGDRAVEFVRGFDIDDRPAGLKKKAGTDWIHDKKATPLGEIVYGKKIQSYARIVPMDTFSTDTARDTSPEVDEAITVSSPSQPSPDPRGRKRSLAERMGMAKADASQNTGRARDIRLEKAKAAKAKQDEERKRAEEAERIRREAEAAAAAEAKRVAAEAKRVAAEAKAAAEAEVARLATIAKAEADTKAAAEAAEAARLAVIARAKEEERRRQEEARLERERTKRIQIEAVSQKVLTELVEDHVAAAAGLARRAYSDEVQSVQLQRDVVTQGVDAELYAVANEVHAHESRIVRLNALEQEVRKRRVLRSWSQMTKRRQSAREHRKPAISTMQRFRKKARLHNPASHAGGPRDTSSLVEAQTSLALEFERRAQISRLYAQWAPIDLKDLLVRRSWQLPQQIYQEKARATLAICPGSKESTMLYHYVHRRLALAGVTSMHLQETGTPVSSPMQRQPLPSGETVSVEWVDYSDGGGTGPGTSTVRACTGVMFLLTIDHEGDVPPHCHPEAWPSIEQLHQCGMSFVEWLRSCGEVVPATRTGNVRGWWRAKCQELRRNARAQEMLEWQSARDRLATVVANVVQHREIALAVVYTSAGTNEDGGTPLATVLAKLGVPDMADRIRTSRVFRVNPMTDADMVQDDSGVLEEGTWWLLKNALNQGTKWRGTLDAAVTNILEALYERSAGGITPAFNVSIFNAALDLFAELLENEDRQAALQTALIGDANTTIHPGVNAAVLRVLAELKLPPLTLDPRQNRLKDGRSLAYVEAALAQQKRSNPAMWKAKVNEFVASPAGVDSFTIQQRIADCKAAMLTVGFSREVLDAVLDQYGAAIGAQRTRPGTLSTIPAPQSKRMRMSTV